MFKHVVYGYLERSSQYRRKSKSSCFVFVIPVLGDAERYRTSILVTIVTQSVISVFHRTFRQLFTLIVSAAVLSWIVSACSTRANEGLRKYVACILALFRDIVHAKDNCQDNQWLNAILVYLSCTLYSINSSLSANVYDISRLLHYVILIGQCD